MTTQRQGRADRFQMSSTAGIRLVDAPTASKGTRVEKHGHQAMAEAVTHCGWVQFAEGWRSVSSSADRNHAAELARRHAAGRPVRVLPFGQQPGSR